jgi:hypothetical protein
MSTTPELSTTISFRQRLWRKAKRVLRSIVIIYLLVCLVMYLLQTKLIFPGASMQGTADAVVKPGYGEELVHLKTKDGVALVGLFGKAEPPLPAPRAGTGGQDARVTGLAENAPRPVVLYFYGNGECMNFSDLQAGIFRDLGCHCLLIDYPGFGMSGGSPSEQGCYEAAEAAYQYLLTRADVDHRKIMVAGWSLGGAVAIDLVHRHRADGTIAGLMTFCTFSSLVDYAQAQYPYLPVSLVLKHRFLSTDKLHDLTLPYFVGHGRSDAIIPYFHSDRVVKAYAGSADNLTRFVSDNADHNDFFDESGEPLKKAIAEFIGRVTK